MADAAGPDTFSFEALLRLLASSMGIRSCFLHTPPRVGLALTGLVGLLMSDMAPTRDAVVGLMDGLLTSGRAAHRHDEAERLAGRERGRTREAVRVRAAAELPRVVAIGTGRAKDGCASMGGIAAAHPVL